MSVAEKVRTVKRAQGTAFVGARLGRLVHEPLLHFLVIGLLIFAGAQAWRGAHDARRIVVTPERTAELVTKYRLQFGAPPTTAQLEGLVEAYIQEEALYREGKAMGLDRDDEIVRRRISQKVEFLQQDRGLPAAPSDADLARYFEAHAATYATPIRTTFSHLYFSTDAVGEGPARTRAAHALDELKAGASDVGADPFPDLNDYSNLAETEAVRLFGDSELAHRLPTAPVGQWSGPYRSGYGWHLVRVDARTPAARPALSDVRDQVREDYLHAAQGQANAQALARLKARYTVVRRDLGPRP
ncbi:MAG: peptidyl-prolyl cis-trans isomerase [Phenylobacterium sp.]